jgi:hypothetical protein
VRRNAYLPKYVDALKYVGLPYERNTSNDSLQSGTITSVAKRKDVMDGALHFRLASEMSELVAYVACEHALSKNPKRSIKYKVMLMRNFVLHHILLHYL